MVKPIHGLKTEVCTSIAWVNMSNLFNCSECPDWVIYNGDNHIKHLIELCELNKTNCAVFSTDPGTKYKLNTN